MTVYADDDSGKPLMPSADSQGAGRLLAANVFFNLLGRVYTSVLALAIVPFVVHRLGPDLYGLLEVVAVVGGFAGLLNLGIGTALSKYVSELYWRRDWVRIRDLFQTAFGMALLAGVGACLAVIAFRGPLASALFHGSEAASRASLLALVFTGLGVMLSLSTEPLAAIPQALQRFDLCNLVRTVIATVTGLGTVLVLAIGYSVRAVLTVDLCSGLIALLAYAHFARGLIPGIRFRPRVRWRDLRYMLRFSLPIVVASVASFAVHSFDRIVVAHYLPIAAVAFYTIPYALGQKTWKVVSNITSVVLPSASELSSKQAHVKVQDLYLRATKMVLLLSTPVIAVLMAIPAPILRYYVGEDFAVRGHLALRLLAAGFLLNILGHVPFVVAQGIGRPLIPARYSLFNAAANVSLFVLLIPRYGIAGAAGAFLISEAIVMPIFVSEVNRVLRLSWKALFLTAYLRPLSCGLAAFASLWFFQERATSLVNVVILVVLALGLFASLALAVAVDQKERRAVLGGAQMVLRAARNASIL